jgi:hypothetical protein
MECSVHERGISCEICSHFANSLLEERLAYFNNRNIITFDLANRGQLVNWCSIMLT